MNERSDKQPSATDAVLGGNSQVHPKSGELTTYEFDLVNTSRQSPGYFVEPGDCREVFKLLSPPD